MLRGCQFLKEEEEPSLSFLLLAHHETENLRRTIHTRFLGKDYYLCSRCTGKYSGILAVFVSFLLGLHIPAWLHLLIMASFPLPSTIDWLTQSIGVRESKNWIRVVTGHLLGIAWGLLFLSLIRGMLSLLLYGVLILATYLASILMFCRFSLAARVLASPLDPCEESASPNSSPTPASRHILDNI